MTSPTLVDVPDAFREEVKGSAPDQIGNLRDFVAKLYYQKLPSDELAEKIASGGWSKEFAGWYSDMVTLHGPYLELHVPIVSAADEEKIEVYKIERAMDAADLALMVPAGLSLLGMTFLYFITGNREGFFRGDTNMRANGLAAFFAVFVVSGGAYLARKWRNRRR